MISDRI